MWLSLVERCVRDAEAASSNLVIPTIKSDLFQQVAFFISVLSLEFKIFII